MNKSFIQEIKKKKQNKVVEQNKCFNFSVSVMAEPGNQTRKTYFQFCESKYNTQGNWMPDSNTKIEIDINVYVLINFFIMTLNYFYVHIKP